MHNYNAHTPSNVSFLKIQRQRSTPKHIIQFISQLQARRLASEIKICAPPNKINEIVEGRIKGKVYLLRRLIKCGKECRRCPHGPYWYGYYRSKGKFISFYLGKKLPPRFNEAQKIQISTQKEASTHANKEHQVNSIYNRPPNLQENFPLLSKPQNSL